MIIIWNTFRLLEESMFKWSKTTFEKFNLPLDEDYISAVEKTMRPVTYSLQTIWVNVFLGVILGLILGGMLKKEKSIFEDDSLSNYQDQRT